MRNARLQIIRAGAIVLTTGLLLVGCSPSDFRPLPQIAGIPGLNPRSDVFPATGFGGTNPYLTAEITNVRVERFQAFAVGSGEQSLIGQPNSQPGYDVVVTAYVSSAIRDTALFNIYTPGGGHLMAKIRFRLVSGLGVALRENEEEIPFTLSERSQMVSTRFSGLSRGELDLARIVFATWVYQK